MKLKIALQKKGRLQTGSFELLNECGFGLNNSQGLLRADARNFPAEVLFLRDDDIPEYVQNGVADLGIVGENEVLESRAEVDIVEKLGFAKCRLSLAIPKDSSYEDLQWFDTKKIATSYPEITKEFLNNAGIDSRIETISGSVEIAPGIGLADAVCDLVSTGSTLLVNGLKEVATVLQSEAVLISQKGLNAGKQALLDDLLFRMNAVRKAKEYKYVLLNAPNDKVVAIADCLPAMKSPTVLPLAEEGWSSMHTVIREEDFWNKIGELKTLGAQGILVSSIERMVN